MDLISDFGPGVLAKLYGVRILLMRKTLRRDSGGGNVEPKLRMFTVWQAPGGWVCSFKNQTLGNSIKYHEL